MVPFQIFAAIVPIPLQGGVQALFAIHDLTGLDHPKFLKGKGIPLHISIECPTVHQRYDHAIGHFSYKHIIFCEFGGVTVKREASGALQSNSNAISASRVKGFQVRSDDKGGGIYRVTRGTFFQGIEIVALTAVRATI